MGTQSGPVNKWLKRISTGLQIIAIPIAGYWAFTRFNAEEAPALEHRAKIQGEVTWRDRSDGDCIGEYNITFENIGKRSIELTSATLRGWSLDVPALSGKIAYVDPLEMRNKPPLVKVDLAPSFIVMRRV